MGGVYESFFFFNDTATTEIYTLSLHDALPISVRRGAAGVVGRPGPGALREAAGAPGPGAPGQPRPAAGGGGGRAGDRKSTRLNSSHANISYAVFCLKKKHSKT